jgi:MFS family permease
MAVQFILPVLARKRFDADEWQTVVITAAPTVLFVLSIFWNDYFARRNVGKYLIVYWLISSLPLAFLAFAENYWWVLVPHLLASLGGSGYYPASGELLRGLYRESSRGRVYGLMTMTTTIATAAFSYGIGQWLQVNEDAFRIYMPLASCLQLAGIAVLAWLFRVTGVAAARTLKPSDGATVFKRLVEPLLHMRQVLKADPIFARYEGAYMTYGVGWMVCFALLPFLVTDKLHLGYDQVAESTHVAYLIALVAALVPAGWLMDRLGAVRSTGLSFGLLTLYPLGLLVAHDARELAVVSVLYGIAHAGANIGWMLGPVALAPSPAKVPQYVAIHATLVGLRGALFQGLAMILYSRTHSFTWPLVLAAVAFVWSALQMWQLHGKMMALKKAVVPEEAIEAVPEAIVAGPTVE